MWWLLIIILIALYMVGQQSKQPNVSTTSTPGADEDVAQPLPEEIADIAQSAKTIKNQTMNNATMHTVTHGSKIIELGSITHSGELKSLGLVSMAKEQGHGNLCSTFKLEISRNDIPVFGTITNMGRSREYTPFNVTPVIDAGTLVQAGDSVRMIIEGKWPGCAIWVKDIVVNIGVLA